MEPVKQILYEEHFSDLDNALDLSLCIIRSMKKNICWDTAKNIDELNEFVNKILILQADIKKYYQKNLK